MTIDETIRHFKELQAFIGRDLPNELLKIVAHDTVGQIHTRVVEQQKNAKGNLFSTYSTKPTLSSGTTAKSKSVWNELAKTADWVTIKRKGKNVHLFVVKGGYREIRKIEGFNNEHKSFEFTTQMWRGFGIKRTEKSSGRFAVVLGGRNAESQDKIDWNSEREGVDIIDASKQERDHIKRQVEREIEKYIKRAKLK